MKSYGDKQLVLIRRALNYYLRLPTHDGTKLNLTSIVQEINEKSGLNIPYETVRKFYTGIKKIDGTYHFQTPQKKEHLDAIVDFLSDPQDPQSPLSLEALKKTAAGHHAPFQLIRYLNGDYPLELLAAPNCLNGDYIYRVDDGNDIYVKLLSISNAQSNGAIELNYEEKIYTHRNTQDIRNHQKLPILRKKNGFSGWGVLTPEESLLMFLQNNVSRRNRYLVSIAFNESLLTGEKLDDLVLFEQDFPLELSKQDSGLDDVSLKDTVQTEIGQNFIRLRRVYKDIENVGVFC